MKRLFTFLFLGRHEKLVKIKSLRPRWGAHGMEWPTMLIDGLSCRMTVTPCWNRGRFKDIWMRLRGKRDWEYSTTC